MKRRFPIIKNAMLWLIFGLALIALSIVVFLKNANPSVQFTGGVEVKTDAAITTENAKSILEPKVKEIGYEDPKIIVSKQDKVNALLIQVPVDNQEQVQKLSNAVNEYIKNANGKVLEQSVIGASVGDYVKSSATKAIIAGLIFIAIYMMFTFSAVRDMISPAVLAIITVVSLLFDVAIPAGAYGLMMQFNPTIQIDLVFIAGILTIMGYSINDTIIIFDRVRENMKLHEQALRNNKMSYMQIFEDSLRQTMRRSLTTSFAALVMVICMWIFGTGIIKTFSFLLGMGIIAGTFSSIFLAAPIAYLMVRRNKGKK